MKKARKQICVIGLGQFGSELARDLARYCDVLALDSDEERVNAISEHVQRAMILDAKDFKSLASLVTAAFDEALVSLGDSLEASVLCTLHLKKIGVKTIRCKALNEDHAEILESLGASEIIFPERETARRVAAHIINPNLLDFVPLAEDYRVMDITPPASFIGHSFIDLNLRHRFGAFVIAVKDPTATRFEFLPGPNYKVLPNDILVMIGRESSLLKIRDEK
jgi:trk system potassium uptake protein TrkA